MNNQVSEGSINISSDSNPLLIEEFNSSKQTEAFSTLKQLQFSGELVVTEPRGRKWIFYLYRGYVLFATGGMHPVRRWQRNAVNYLPEQLTSSSNLSSELPRNNGDNSNLCWQYQLLCLWVKQGKISREQATKVIWSTLVEVLFDITQAKTISYQLKPNQRLSAEIVAIDPERIVAEVERRWLSWQAVKGVNYNPNQSPFIKQLDQLQQCTSAAVCQMLVQMLDGQKTLRDLAIEMKRDILTVIRSLQPYIQSGLIELANIPDLPAPVLATPGARTIQKPLIACVDDSPLICQSLERLLLSRGYRFVGIDDPLRAIGILLALKPDVIFLDLMMPNTNGYEICDRLRRIAIFRNTPIIILTGNDGVVDRVKAKMVGASDFLSKTKVDADLVLEVLHKHLRHCTLSKLTEPNSPGLEKGTQVA